MPGSTAARGRMLPGCPTVGENAPTVLENQFSAAGGSMFPGRPPATAAAACRRPTLPLLPQVLLLQAAIKFEMDDLMNARAFIEQCPPDEADTVVNHACVMFKEAKQPGADPALFEQARLKFVEALNASGFKAELAYSI